MKSSLKYLLTTAASPDLLVIPALSGDMKEAISANELYIPWIKAQYDAGSEIASLGVGAFLLGATGLLDGKKCSTHWGIHKSISGALSNCTGAGWRNSDGRKWHLLQRWGQFLLEFTTSSGRKICGSEDGDFGGKIFCNRHRPKQSNSLYHVPRTKKHQDEAVKKAPEYIKKKLEERITVDVLAVQVAVGRRSFERRFKLVTNNSVLEYIQPVKVEAAMKNITEVMLDVGYSDTKAFRTTFKKITGLTPIEYRIG